MIKAERKSSENARCRGALAMAQGGVRGWGAFFSTLILCSPMLEGVLDLDGNGFSDIWESTYDAAALDPDVDSDGDGLSNLEESVHGSDPRDPESKFSFEGYSFDQEHSILTMDIRVLGGHRYFIESSLSLEPGASWRVDKGFYTGGDGELSFECPVSPADVSRRFFRVRQELDEDKDGLTAFEEKALGLDDRNFNSGSPQGGGDLAWLVERLTDGVSFPLLGGGEIVGFERTSAEISRFLNQATFGPTMEMIEQMEQSDQSYGEWIDEQLAMPASTLKDAMATETALGATVDHFMFRRGWWRSAVNGPDQLRQRMALALSEILVVSGQGSDLVRGSYEGAGAYYDLLINGAFGNYVDLLEDVTYSIAMGTYLGHLRNFKADPELGTFPDENYARELMQLFTIGLWELEQDGQKKLDLEGRPIPTYDNFHVTELAKVMTGFNWANTSQPTFYNNHPDLPMKIFDSVHDKGEKFLAGDGYLPANLQASDDVRRAVEHLGRHPNVGPFLGRHLIQRFVTSNPSLAYVERVAGAYLDNGDGVVGDLSAVIRAVLLDPEARAVEIRSRPGFGKLREPFITYVHLVRAFDATNENGSFPILTTDGHLDMGQIPLDSPTVFNFFSPDYQPSELRGESMVAPEFEILTPLRSTRWDNLLRRGIETGVDPARISVASFVLHHDYSDELALADDPEALIDRLDLMFCYGSMESGQKEIIQTALESLVSHDPWLQNERRLETAIHLVMTSPDYVILR